jgi:predicted dehydrogenase
LASDKVYKVAVAGLVHGHIGGLLNNWKNFDRAEIVAVAEPDAALAASAKERYGIPTVYADWREMLANEEFDILQVGADNQAKTEIIVAAAQAGKAITAEKPLAVNLDAAKRIRDAVAAARVPFLTNWWTAYQAGRRTLARLAREGAVGDIWQVKERMGHAGPKEIGCGPEFVSWLYDADKNGGGAGADFCGYGAVFAADLLGRPESVFGTTGNLTKDYPVPDDNAVMVARYPKAIAILEGTWSQQGSDGTGYPIVYGTTGTLSQGGKQVRLDGPNGVQMVDHDLLPEHMANHAVYFVHCIETGTEPEGILSLDNCLIAQEIVEAGYESARTGKNVSL